MINNKLSIGIIQDFVKTDTNYCEKIELLQFIVNELQLQEITTFVNNNKLNNDNY